MDIFPEWLRTPLIGALIAALAYVSKLAIEGLSKWSAARRERRANLVVLQSLLLASRSVFEIQNVLVQRLCRDIQAAHPEIEGTYDRILAAGYAHLTERQKLEHGLIRSFDEEGHGIGFPKGIEALLGRATGATVD